MFSRSTLFRNRVVLCVVMMVNNENYKVRLLKGSFNCFGDQAEKNDTTDTTDFHSHFNLLLLYLLYKNHHSETNKISCLTGRITAISTLFCNATFRHESPQQQQPRQTLTGFTE